MESSPAIMVVDRPKNLDLTPDPYVRSPGVELELETSISPDGNKRHVLDLYKEHGSKVTELVKQAVAEELIKLGVEFEFVRSKGGNKVRKSPRSRNSKDRGSPGNGLKRMVEVEFPNAEAKIAIPLIVKETCDFIRKHVTNQGIFRVSGSAARSQAIMQRFMNEEIEDFFTFSDTVHDVAIVLKQYLRELEIPVIPPNLHHIFLQCWELQPESAQTSALMLAFCIVPWETIACLTYVLQFLAEVAEHSSENLMTVENLSIVMGPNIMPMEIRKSDKSKEAQKPEKIGLDSHKFYNKIVELLIKHSDSIGVLSDSVDERIESLLMLRSSEDELDEDVGRRKKRRSGSLTRITEHVVDFFKKVTNGGRSAAATPMTPLPKTPGGDIFSFTPVIRNSSKKAGVESALALHKNPLKPDWKHQTPNTNNRLKNFTPAFLGRKTASKETDKNTFSAPAKPSKSRIRFGRSRNHKKVSTPDVDAGKQDIAAPSTTSEILKHRQKHTNSPKTNPISSKHPSASRLPRPAGVDKPALPPKRANFGCSNLRSNNAFSKSPLKQERKMSTSTEGDYVTISASADLCGPDKRNDAFLASSDSLSLLTSDDSNSIHLNESKSNGDLESTKNTNNDDSTFLEAPPKLNLNLSPLINEIDMLTRTAQDLTLSTLRGKSTSSIRSTEGLTLPESPTELDTTPLNVEQVEQKYIDTLKETKIMWIQRECKNSGTEPLQRRLSSVKDSDINQKTPMSPSQRKIVTTRRKSQESGRVTPAVTPGRFMSLRSPRTFTPRSPAQTNSASMVKRSPMRCTLKRGRPNTARTGLARPSPVRGSGRLPVEVEDLQGATLPPRPPKQETKPGTATPLRRMSSVHELVKKLEHYRGPETDQCKANTTQEPHKQESSPSPVCNTSKPLSPPLSLSKSNIFTRSQTRNHTRPRTPFTPSLVSLVPNAGEDQLNWVSANQFQFDRNDFQNMKKSTDRDSIHFLKTLRAGRVPATVEFFNRIGHHKSPAKSLIPRYTALHQREVEKVSCNTRNEEAPETPSRLTRRMSSVDVDLHNQKKEELLERIKKETRVKRSNTTAGFSRNHHVSRSLRPLEKLANASAKRPTTLNLGLTSPNIPPKSNPRVPSFHRNIAQTPRILEEDESESLVTVVSQALEKMMKPSETSDGQGKVISSCNNKSPLKTSNFANSNMIRKDLKVSPLILKTSPSSYNIRKRNTNVSLSRTASENGTKSTTSTTPKVTPKIKKSLTTRPYDIAMPPRPRASPAASQTPSTENPPSSNRPPLRPKIIPSPMPSTAHSCPTITPRRKVPRMGNGGFVVPNSDKKTKMPTPLKAVHVATPFS